MDKSRCYVGQLFAAAPRRVLLGSRNWPLHRLHRTLVMLPPGPPLRSSTVSLPSAPPAPGPCRRRRKPGPSPLRYGVDPNPKPF